MANVRTAWLVTAAAVVLGTASAGCSNSSDNPTPSPQTSRTGSVWVADEGGDSLTVLDAANGAVAATLTGLRGPHNVQTSRDGATVYATSSATNMVVGIDAATYRVTAASATGPAPAHVIEAPNGKVYVVNSGDGTVSVFRAQGLQPAGQIAVGGMPHGIRAAAGGSVIVVANTMAGEVDLIDPGADRFLGAIAVGKAPAQVAVTADGRYAYAGTTEPPAVVKVDLTARKVVGSIGVSAAPVQLYLTPDEATLLSADQGTRAAPGRALSVIDTAAMTLRGTVATGAGPHGVVVDDTGTRAWVTNSYENTVSVVDLGTKSVQATIPVGNGPNGISYSPRPPTASAASVALDIPGQPAGSTSAPPHPHGPGHS